MRTSLAVVPVLAALALFVAREAAATPNFPSAVQTALSLTYSPACDLCHAGGTTTAQTVTTPFALSMKARGMVASDETALRAALDRMAADKVDSDQDGVTDTDELKAGTNPNIPAGQEPMTYGCSAAARGARSGAPAYGGVILGAALFGLLRRKRASVAR